MLPLLVVFVAFESLVRNRLPCFPGAGSLHFAVAAPLSPEFWIRRPPSWNDWAENKKPPEIGMFHEKGDAIL